MGSVYSAAFCSCCSTLYDEGYATVPKLAEKLTLELVHHIEVTILVFIILLILHSSTIYCIHE